MAEQLITMGGLDSISGVSVTLTVELGRARFPIKHLMNLTPGALITLDTAEGEPLLILVNNRPIAKGVVVLVNGKIGVRVTEILGRP